MWKTL